MARTVYTKRPSELTANELHVLVQAYDESNGGLVWILLTDQFVASDGMYTRAGRSMRGARYIRAVSPVVHVWLTRVANAGKNAADEPARLMEITPDGIKALRKRMGEDWFRQATARRDNYRERVSMR